jgi:protein SCO1/2
MNWFICALLFLVAQLVRAEAPVSVSAQASTAEKQDTIYVSEGKWVSQTNVERRFNDLKGTPRVMTMVFTKCPSACPLIVSDIKRIEAQLSKKAKSQVRFTLFSFDPKNDQPEALAAFAKKMKLGPQWDLFVANEADTRELAAILGVQYKQIPSGEFIHTNMMIAVDSEGRMLAQRDGFEKPVDPLAKALNHSIGRK